MTKWSVDLSPSSASQAWLQLIPPALSVLGVGILFFAFGDHIYRIFEARMGWPRFISDRRTARQNVRFERLLELAERIRDTDRQQFNEIWFKLRPYPLHEDGTPYVSKPTLIGNNLAGYEQYPLSRYGMDSIFYWPRIWLTLDKEKKVEIDQAWSVGDGLLYSSAAAMCGGVIWLALAAVYAVVPSAMRQPQISWWRFGIGWIGLFWILLGYAVYRASLPFHRNNEETFKAIFDINREGLASMTRFDVAETTKWTTTWAYLQYLKCANCGRPLPKDRDRCECGHDAVQSISGGRVESSDPLRPPGKHHSDRR